MANMKKTEDFYFSSFVGLVDYSVKAAEFLSDIINHFDYSKMELKKDQIHKIEHDADLAKHNVTERLVKEFLPPIDREDVLNIIRDIDDVTDSVEEIALRLYMYDVKEIRPEVRKFLDVILECCIALKRLMEDFSNFKKSKTMKQSIFSVLKLEEKCDQLYTNALHNLYVKESDPNLLSIWSDLFHRLENCCDACGNVSSTVETAYMKNL